MDERLQHGAFFILFCCPPSTCTPVCTLMNVRVSAAYLQVKHAADRELQWEMLPSFLHLVSQSHYPILIWNTESEEA